MLINCVECNRKISSTAKACPQCGSLRKPSYRSYQPSKFEREITDPLIDLFAKMWPLWIIILFIFIVWSFVRDV